MNRPEDIAEWAWDRALRIEGGHHPGIVEACARALLKVREDAFEWQPMETAPKDGSRILTHGDGLVGTSRWVTHFAPAYRFDGEAWYSEQLDRPHLPTEWMPLPPPPAIRQHSQKGER